MKVAKGGTGPKGIAGVSFNKDKTKVRVDLDGETYVLPVADCPSWLKNSGKYNVTLDSDATVMYSCRPPQSVDSFGICTGLVIGRDEKLPKPVFREAKAIKTAKGSSVIPEHYEFRVEFELWHPDYYGCRTTYPFNYAFMKDAIEDVAVIKGPGREKLWKFLSIFGFEDVEIPWSDNILPELGKHLNSNILLTLSTGQDGYLKEIRKADLTMAQWKKMYSTDSETDFEPEAHNTKSNKAPYQNLTDPMLNANDQDIWDV